MKKLAALALLLPNLTFAAEPFLPMGLGSGARQEYSVKQSSDWKDKLPFDFSGFVETRYGQRLQNDPTQKDSSIGEIRAQLSAEKATDFLAVKITADVLYDPVLGGYSNNFETGKGWLDLREASLLFRPTDNSDIKLGRQTLTWGTGDLLFINDMFPKDWNSFFIGRDEEYLKAPSDAAKFSYFTEVANINFVYTPQFDSDRYLDGSRLSHYNGTLGRIAGSDAPVLVDRRVDAFSEDEIAVRLYRNIKSFETALYYYNGYWKSPEGQDVVTGLYTFPKLSVYGASVRGPVGKGIGNFELGYYDSHDDNNGNNARIRNSEWRFLLGYEQELLPEFTGAFQYYVELMDDYGNYKNTLPAGSFQKDDDRHVVTLRLTKLLMNQNLTLSLFNYYSPTDNDGYSRPKVHYKFDDHWQAEVGGNIFYQDNRETFFGQLQDNSNVFVGLRYGF
jgi:hypothetical protein